VISVTAIGAAKREDLVYRDGAAMNDLICVTGDLGAAYMGLQLLQREKEVYLETPTVQPDLTGYDYLLERQLKPEARKDIIARLKELKIKPTSMIDISDGLSSELLHICTQSKVGCQVYEEKIPIDHLTRQLAEEFEMVATVAAMNGGEDYELLFTIPLADYDKIKDRSEISIIGHITDQASGCFMIDTSENVVPLTAQGWNSLNK
jgi:thiamine-monophosphate kinase